MITAAIYDPQPPGSGSGPIRFVTSVPNQGILDRMGHPYVLLDDDGRGISYATHRVVDGSVKPLDGAAPPALTVIAPPS